MVKRLFLLLFLLSCTKGPKLKTLSELWPRGINNLDANGQNITNYLVKELFSEPNIVSLIDEAIKKGADISFKDSEGNNALNLIPYEKTSIQNCLPIIDVLLKNGADPNVSNYSKVYPLYGVLIYGFLNIEDPLKDAKTINQILYDILSTYKLFVQYKTRIDIPAYTQQQPEIKIDKPILALNSIFQSSITSEINRSIILEIVEIRARQINNGDIEWDDLGEISQGIADIVRAKKEQYLEAYKYLFE